mmetsp:Transcript_17604/g.46878  ORF Transcript_17604/g.46878 Transcript_17604/m.46878 type:complete len:205 (+) Transcript_17604:51-665(+)
MTIILMGSADRVPVAPPMQLHLKVRTRGSVPLVHFKLNENSPLKRLMDSFCSRMGVQRRYFRFSFRGQSIRDADTCVSLRMKEGDEIDAVASVGSEDDEAESIPALTKLEDDAPRLKVMVRTNGTSSVHIKFVFILNKDTPLKKLMDIYCRRMGKVSSFYRFVFRGQRVRDEDTSISLRMKDGDVIDAFLPRLDDAELGGPSCC